MRTTAAVLLWGLAISPVPVANAASAAGWTPFALAEQGGIIVQAMLNGTGPFQLLLDTGATHSSISEDVVRVLSAPIVASTTLTTSAGTGLHAVARLDRFELGPVSAVALLPSVIRTEAIDPTGVVQGVIGQDVLAALRYTIDFPARRIIWDAAADGPAYNVSTFALEPVNGRFVIAVPQQGATLRLVPDTGSGGLVLFVRPDRPAVTTTKLGSSELVTVVGRMRVRQARVRELRIGATRFSNVTAVLVPKPRAERSEADGLLPLHWFRRVTFDGPRRLMIVDHSWPRGVPRPESAPEATKAGY